MVVLRVLAVLVGAAITCITLGSAIRTVVIPRGEELRITRGTFRFTQRVFELRRSRMRTWAEEEAILARYPGVALLLLPFAWIALIIVGCAAIFWGLGVPGPGDALSLSGASVTTLGFIAPPDHPTTVVAVIEATIGLGMVALLISFLPTMYSQFTQRELMVSLLATRAGSPPRPDVWLIRAQQIGWMDERLDDQWLEWERWFVTIEEAHTSYPALNFFRSPVPDRHWVTSAGAVLDTAAMRVAVLDLGGSVEAQLCIRSGFLALRRIADYFHLPHDPDPHSSTDSSISVTRQDFDAAVGRMRDAGVPLVADLEQAWRDFVGWRVNYDDVLGQLCTIVQAPSAPWSGDTVEPTRAHHGERGWLRNPRPRRGNRRSRRTAGD